MGGAWPRVVAGLGLGSILGAIVTAATTTALLITPMLQDGDPLRDPPVFNWLGLALGLILSPIAGFWLARRFGWPGFLGSLAGCGAGLVAALALPNWLLTATGTPWQSSSFAGMASWMLGGLLCFSLIFLGGIIGLIRRRGAVAPAEPVRW